MQTENSKYAVIEGYIERVYSFAKNHTYSMDEAEELSQEIYLQLCKCIATVRSDTSIEAWIWSVSRNTLCAYRRKKGKDRDNVFYYGDSNVVDDIEDTTYDDERFNILRDKLVKLSAEYRNILVMYYFDNLSVRDIADKLGITESTIKWRLSEGRNKIKREWDNNMNDTMITPKKIRVNITGSGIFGNGIPYPGEYFDDALAQNILWHTRKEGKSVEELSVLTGVPAYYIEDRINNMGWREALVKVGNKYKTDFVIYDAELVNAMNAKGYELAEKMYKPVVNAIKSIDGEFCFWRNGIIVTTEVKGFDFVERDQEYYNNKYSRIRYDGHNWLYHGYESDELFNGIWWTANGSDKCEYASVAYKFRSSISHKVKDNLKTEQVDLFYDIKHNGIDSVDKDAVIKLLDTGYLKKENDKIELNLPYYTREEYKAIVEAGNEALSGIREQYVECMRERNDYYAKLIGHELRNNIFEFNVRDFYAICVDLALENGLINPPKDEWCDWIREY